MRWYLFVDTQRRCNCVMILIVIHAWLHNKNQQCRMADADSLESNWNLLGPSNHLDGPDVVIHDTLNSAAAAADHRSDRLCTLIACHIYGTIAENITTRRHGCNEFEGGDVIALDTRLMAGIPSLGSFRRCSHWSHRSHLTASDCWNNWFSSVTNVEEMPLRADQMLTNRQRGLKFGRRCAILPVSESRSS